MEVRELICINCPLGCPMTVKKEEDRILVEGNTCKRGEDYAIKEIKSPARVVTSTVVVEGGEIARVSVKTRHDIPKGMIFSCMEEIKKVKTTAPVQIGDVLIENCAGTGVDIIATKKVEAVRHV